jgi:hypothetical protein
MKKKLWRFMSIIIVTFCFTLSARAVEAQRWVNIGPAPIPGGGYESFGMFPVTGRVADIATDPDNPSPLVNWCFFRGSMGNP